MKDQLSATRNATLAPDTESASCVHRTSTSFQSVSGRLLVDIGTSIRYEETTKPRLCGSRAASRGGSRIASILDTSPFSIVLNDRSLCGRIVVRTHGGVVIGACCLIQDRICFRRWRRNFEILET